MLISVKFDNKQIKELLKTMVLLIDNREQMDHVDNYCKSKKIASKRCTLSQGDYSAMIPKNEELGLMQDIYFDKQIVIERKNSAEEIASCLATQRERFQDELMRCKANNTKIILLIENATYEGIVSGDYRSKLNNKAFIASLMAFQSRFDMEVVYMKRDYSAQYILNRLFYFIREYLKE